MTTLLPDFEHIVNPRLKHTYLSFSEEGRLIVRSPRVSHRYIEALLIRKAAWIRRSQEKILAKKGRLDACWEKGLHYLGKPYPLELNEKVPGRALLVFEETHFVLTFSAYDPEKLMKPITAFYKQEAERTIPALVEKWASLMGVSPQGVRFRKTRRQWGSCSAKNVLSFNTMLMKLPLEVIEYVVVHELAHIRHKHHQKAFWDLVRQTMPDYRSRIATLHTFTPA
jgi:predicted metal-dependent hydrolase